MDVKLLIFYGAILFYQEICSLSLSPVWRPVLISQSVPTNSITASAKNAIQCIQICLRTDGCQLSCYDGGNCESSKILLYSGHQASSSGGTKSCYTRLGINFAVGSEMKGPPTSTEYSTATIENIMDGIYVSNAGLDCYATVETSNVLYVLIDLTKVVPVRNISLLSQPNPTYIHKFHDISIFTGNEIDEEAMDNGDFSLLELVGMTKPVKNTPERQSFGLAEPKFVRYVILQKNVFLKLQICEIEIS